MFQAIEFGYSIIKFHAKKNLCLQFKLKTQYHLTSVPEESFGSFDIPWDNGLWASPDVSSLKFIFWMEIKWKELQTVALGNLCLQFKLKPLSTTHYLLTFSSEKFCGSCDSHWVINLLECPIPAPPPPPRHKKSGWLSLTWQIPFIIIRSLQLVRCLPLVC